MNRKSVIVAKINFDAATKGNPGISTCAIVIEDEQHYTYTHELGEMDNHTAEWAAIVCIETRP